MFLVAMATATRGGELLALSYSSVSHRGDDLVLHYDPFFFFWIKQNRCRNPSQINHILVSTRLVGDLPEQVLCPVRTVRYLR